MEEGYSKRVRESKDTCSEDMKKKLCMLDPEVLALHYLINFCISLLVES